MPASDTSILRGHRRQSQPTRYVDPCCWANVADGGPALKQHCVIVSFLLGRYFISCSLIFPSHKNSKWSQFSWISSQQLLRRPGIDPTIGENMDPVNTNVDLMLAHRLRCWAGIKSRLGELWWCQLAGCPSSPGTMTGRLRATSFCWWFTRYVQVIVGVSGSHNEWPLSSRVTKALAQRWVNDDPTTGVPGHANSANVETKCHEVSRHSVIREMWNSVNLLRQYWIFKSTQ